VINNSITLTVHFFYLYIFLIYILAGIYSDTEINILSLHRLLYNRL